MPAKAAKRARVAPPSSSSSAAATDWRAPLFVWRGALRADAAARELSWRGAWLAAKPGAGAPAGAALAASENAFECAADAGGLGPALALALGVAAAAASAKQAEGEAAAAAPAAAAVSAAAAAAAATAAEPATSPSLSSSSSSSFAQPLKTAAGVLRALAGASFALRRSSYLLDQGNGRGRQRFEDLRHELAFASESSGVGVGNGGGGGGSLAVAAVGETEFGRFVSYGRAEAAGDAVTLTLARRYVGDCDARAALISARAALSSCEDLAVQGTAAGAAAGAAAAAAAGMAPEGAAAAWEIERALPWRVDKRAKPRKQ